MTPTKIIEKQNMSGSAQPTRMTVAHQNEAARNLLREWLSDKSGYDEETWPQAKKVIEENRLSPRSRFDD